MYTFCSLVMINIQVMLTKIKIRSVKFDWQTNKNYLQAVLLVSNLRFDTVQIYKIYICIVMQFNFRKLQFIKRNAISHHTNNFLFINCGILRNFENQWNGGECSRKKTWYMLHTASGWKQPSSSYFDNQFITHLICIIFCTS